MELQHNKQNSRELSSQLVSIMTTEHYNLQTGRAMTVSEANGRASLFVGAVSSGLIALALVAQLSHLGTAFFVFSLVVLPTLLFMGLIIFQQESMLPTWVQSFLGMASMVAIITSVLAGSFLGMLFILIALPLWACIVAGGIGFLVSVVLLQTYQQGQWVRLRKNIPVNFPRQPIS